MLFWRGAEMGFLLFLGLYGKGLVLQCASLLVSSLVREGKVEEIVFFFSFFHNFSNRPLEK